MSELTDDAKFESLPQKSKRKYTLAFKRYENWLNEKGNNEINEKTLLHYLYDLKKQYNNPSTVRAHHSMIKSYLLAKKCLNIDCYLDVSQYLRMICKGHEPVKAKVFTPEELKKFFDDAPDHIYLGKKAIAVVALCGACRCDELHKILISDIEDDGHEISIEVEATKDNKKRSFTVIGQFYDILKKYMSFRTENITINSLFVKYSNGKCFNQPVGKNTIGKVPKEIALFLQLEDVHLYTGHAFRRTSAIAIIDQGANVETLKLHGGWKSNTIAVNFIKESKNAKRKVTNMLLNSLKYTKDDESTPEEASTSSLIYEDKQMLTEMLNQADPIGLLEQSEENQLEQEKSQQVQSEQTDLQNRVFSVAPSELPSLSFQNCTNFSINFIKKE